MAESQFARAVWLNPYEATFKKHFAWCLYKLEKYHEAIEWIMKALEQKDESESKDILRIIELKLQNSQ